MNILALEMERDLRHEDYMKAFARMVRAVKLSGPPLHEDTPLQRSARIAARAVAERWELFQAADHAYRTMAAA